MADQKHKEPLTRKQCHETLCRMYSVGYTAAITVATVVFWGLTALAVFVMCTYWSDDLIQNIIAILLCDVVAALGVTLLACTIHVYRFIFPIRKGEFLIVEDELKYVRENIRDRSFQPRFYFSRRKIPFRLRQKVFCVQNVLCLGNER